jgi:AraC-like DNA-binding protein
MSSKPDRPVDQDAWSIAEQPHETYKMRLLTQLAVERGASLQSCLAGSGVHERMLEDPSARIAGWQVLIISSNVATAVPEELGVGVAYVRGLQATAFGPLGYALMCKPTLYDALETLVVRYPELSGTVLPPSLEEDDEDLRVVLDDEELRAPDVVRRQLVEGHLAGVLTVLQHVLGARLVPKSVELRPPAHPTCRPFEEVFGVQASFERSRNVLTFSRKDLLKPLPLANPHTDAAMDILLQERVAKLRAQREIGGRVRILLQQDPSRIVTIDEVALELSMSRRSLTRRLEAEGLRFRDLVEEGRRRASEQLLPDRNISLDDVAAKVGYSDRASFIRAFKRWHGVTPRQWRKAREAGSHRQAPKLSSERA